MVSLRQTSRQDAVRWFIAATALLLVILRGSGYWSSDAYWRVVHSIDDWRHRVVVSHTPSPRVAIIDIDERSLAAIGPWPWPRLLQATLLTSLFERDRVAAVGLDVLFPEDEPTGPGDADIVALSRRFPLVFAQAFDFSAAERASSSGNLSGALPSLSSLEVRRKLYSAPVAAGYIGNFFAAQSAPCTGHVTPQPDSDGTVRAIAPFMRYEGALYPMLALQMIRCGPGGNALDWNALERLAARLPATRQPGHAAIPFQRSRDGFEVFAALDVITGRIPPEKLAGRYVLVGSSAMGLSDRIASPIDPWLPGVIVHAELLDWLLQERALPSPRLDLGWLAWAWAAASILLFAWLFRTQKAWLALTVLSATTAGWLAAATALASRQYWIGIDPPLLVAATFLLVQAPFEWITAQSRARAFEHRFGRYLPPVVLREMLRQGNEHAFAPKRHLITVLFVDIAGFTAMAQHMEPEELVALTDKILSRLTEYVYATDGTLDKYIGDALMAFWGAPVPADDHADRAIACARAMIAGMDRLNQELLRTHGASLGGKPIRIRVGVNSGEAVVGEIGSAVRRSYTALGDPVNIAARLQDYAREVEQDLFIGQRTAELSHRHALRPFVSTLLRGRSHHEDVYVVAPDSGKNGEPAASAGMTPRRHAAPIAQGRSEPDDMQEAA